MKRQILKRKLKEPALIVDSKYIAYRTKHSRGFSLLSHKDIQTGLYYGFFNTVKSLAKKFDTGNIFFMWDVGKTSDSKRREQFGEYKRRKNTQTIDPEELERHEMFDLEYNELKNVCDEMGFAGYSLNRYEADDLIALFCKQFSGKKVIITRDEDMYQCLSLETSMYSPDDKHIKTDSWFKKEYGITPEQWYLVKSMAGCKSDTVPGLSGIGEDKAIKYILDNLPDKTKTYIEENKKLIDFYAKLVKLPHEDVLNVRLEAKETNLDMSAFMHMCQRMGFRQFMNNLDEWKIFWR